MFVHHIGFYAESQGLILNPLTLCLADATTGAIVETLTATQEHPFYVDGQGFVPAGRLAVGNAIVTRAGPGLVVQSVTWQRHPEGIAVYNLVVEEDHTYFVGKANGGVWVHNVVCPISPDQQALMDLARDSSRILTRRPHNPYISADEANALWTWGHEYGVNVSHDPGGLAGHWHPLPGPAVPHINIGQWHVPVPPGWTPP